MKVLLVTPFLTYAWNTGNLILKALGELKHYCIVWDPRASYIPDIHDYDVAIVQKGETVNPEDLKSPKINWFPDRLSRNPELHETLKKYDRIFTWNLPEHEWAEWLPLGFDPDVHRDFGLERRFDYIYIGTANSKRKVEWIKQIKPQIIAGSNWEEYGLNVYQPMHIPQFIRFMNLSKIVLNVHESAWGINDKTFFIPNCSFMLIDDIPGVRELFGDKVADKISFSSPKEANDLIKFYLDNSEERQAAWMKEKEVITPYTCRKQVTKLLEKF